jgi:hypothetical protein
VDDILDLVDDLDEKLWEQYKNKAPLKAPERKRRTPPKEFGLSQKYGLEAEVGGHIPGAEALVPLLSGDAQFSHAAGPVSILLRTRI